SGAFTWDTTRAGGLQPKTTDTARATVPIGTVVGVPTQFRFYAYDQWGQYGSAARNLAPMADTTPPQFTLLQFAGNIPTDPPSGRGQLVWRFGHGVRPWVGLVC